MAVQIRQALAQDFPILRELEDQIFPEDPWTDGMIVEELSSAYRAYFIAEETAPDGGEASVLGYAGLSLGLDCDVMTVGVIPQVRGGGIGSLLVTTMIEVARQSGAERMFLEVRESNIAAQKLYEKHGFEYIGRVRQYFRHPLEDAITMRLTGLSEISVA